MTYRIGDWTTDRCPLSLLRRNGVQEILGLYGEFDKGLTPNGRGMRYETALYRSAMQTCSALQAEADDFRIKNPPKK